MRSLNFILGLTVGVLVGTAVAMLLAPASGEDTKRNLREMTEQAKKKTERLRQRGRQYIESEREHIHEAVEAGRHAAREKREQLERELASAQSTVV